MDKGIYVLLFENEACTITVGALGVIHFQKGWHAYVGSALGTGGFVRVRRHVNLYNLKNKDPHWHIDYLLLSSGWTVRKAYGIATLKRIECLIAHKMEGEPISHFGSSDCSCNGHLFYYSDCPDTSLLKLLQEITSEEHIVSDPSVLYENSAIHGKGIV